MRILRLTASIALLALAPGLQARSAPAIVRMYPQARIPGPGGTPASAPANVNCGANITDHTNSDNGNNNGVRLMKCTTGANPGGYAVAKCHVYLVAAASGNIQCGLFGATTFPLLCSTGSQAAVANSDNSIVPSGCGPLAASTVFWLGFNNDTAGIAYGTSAAACTGSGGTQLSYSVAFGTWASGPSTSAGNCNYQIWLELTPL